MICWLGPGRLESEAKGVINSQLKGSNRHCRRILNMDTKEEAVLDAMKKEGKPMRPGDIAKKAEMDKGEVSKIISKLKKEGKIISPKQCFYAPVE